MNPSQSQEIDFIKDAAVKSLADNILTALDKHYPAYSGQWNLVINTKPTGGIIQVRNMLISGKRGFQLPISWIDSEMRVMVRYAGELLERYRLSREKNVDIVDEIKGLRRNGIGEAIHDE